MGYIFIAVLMMVSGVCLIYQSSSMRKYFTQQRMECIESIDSFLFFMCLIFTFLEFISGLALTISGIAIFLVENMIIAM